MPSGSGREEVARADRMRERAAQKRRGTKNGLDALRDAEATLRDLPAYREEFDSVSEVTAGPQGLKARGSPREAWKWIGVGIAVFLVCLGAAVVMAAR